MQNENGFGSTNHESLMQVRAKHKGETYNGEVIDADPSSGDNPVIDPGANVPNIIVNGEKAVDYDEGDRISLVKVTSVHEGDGGFYMFGERIKSDEEREQEQANEFQVVLKFMGNKMTSQNFKDEDDAQDLADFLESQVDVGRVEVNQTR